MMDHKIVAVCLMTSHRITQVLKELAVAEVAGNDSHMAVIAALKLLKPSYHGLGVVEIAEDLKSKSSQELLALARALHPVLCSLKLEKWLGVSGQCHYLAQSAAPRGGKIQRMVLDDSAHEILAAGQL